MFIYLSNLKKLSVFERKGKSEQINCGSFHDNSNQCFTFQSNTLKPNTVIYLDLKRGFH